MDPLLYDEYDTTAAPWKQVRSNIHWPVSAVTKQPVLETAKQTFVRRLPNATPPEIDTETHCLTAPKDVLDMEAKTVQGVYGTKELPPAFIANRSVERADAGFKALDLPMKELHLPAYQLARFALSIGEPVLALKVGGKDLERVVDGTAAKERIID